MTAKMREAALKNFSSTLSNVNVVMVSFAAAFIHRVDLRLVHTTVTPSEKGNPACFSN